MGNEEQSAPTSPQERLAKIEQCIAERAARYWEPDHNRRGAVLPFREKRQTKVLRALLILDPVIGMQTAGTSPLRFKHSLLHEAKTGDERAVWALSKQTDIIQVDAWIRDLIGKAQDDDENALRALGWLGERLVDFPEVSLLLYEKARRGSPAAIHAIAVSALVELGARSAEFSQLKPILMDNLPLEKAEILHLLGTIGKRLAEVPEAFNVFLEKIMGRQWRITDAMIPLKEDFLLNPKQTSEILQQAILGNRDAIKLLSKASSSGWRLFHLHPTATTKFVITAILARGGHPRPLKPLAPLLPPSPAPSLQEPVPLRVRYEGRVGMLVKQYPSGKGVVEFMQEEGTLEPELVPLRALEFLDQPSVPDR